VLIHVGFAMSKISDVQAKETLAMLDELGEAENAREEVQGSAETDQELT
jgi:hydrogenase expression/formation protein HypC